MKKMTFILPIICVVFLVGCSVGTKIETVSSTASEVLPAASEISFEAIDPTLITQDILASQNITITNNTGRTIQQLFVSPADQDSWQENLLTVKRLLTGESVAIGFEQGDALNFWDLKVIDEKGDAIHWKNLDLAIISEITLSFDGEVPTATYQR